MKSLFHEMPLVDSDRPRDGRYLFGTEDTPFLALKLLQGGDSPLHEFKDTCGDPFYSHEVGSEITCRPIEARTLRKFFKRRFFGFRQRLSERRIHNSLYAYSINGVLLRGSRTAGDQKLWEFGRSLVHPFDEQGDSLLEHLPVQKFYNWHDWGGESYSSTIPYCPLDGPIAKTLTASVHFSPDTISPACGHRWSFPVCPYCLGILADRIGMKI